MLKLKKPDRESMSLYSFSNINMMQPKTKRKSLNKMNKMLRTMLIRLPKKKRMLKTNEEILRRKWRMKNL